MQTVTSYFKSIKPFFNITQEIASVPRATVRSNQKILIQTNKRQSWILPIRKIDKRHVLSTNPFTYIFLASSSKKSTHPHPNPLASNIQRQVRILTLYYLFFSIHQVHRRVWPQRGAVTKKNYTLIIISILNIIKDNTQKLHVLTWIIIINYVVN